MPTVDEILGNATRIANEATAFAIAWHIVLAAVVVALLAGWRPMQRTARMLVALPLVSVAALALRFENPFNGVVLAVGALALLIIGSTARSARVPNPGPLASIAGIGAVAFGWVYPHFLAGDWTRYLYASPFGLVPCPTLAVACGFALLGSGLGSRAWTFALAMLGLFFGVFGVFRLGVYLDVPLIATAAFLAWQGHCVPRRATVVAPSG